MMAVIMLQQTLNENICLITKELKEISVPASSIEKYLLTDEEYEQII